MALNLYSENGYVQGVATVTGYADLLATVDRFQAHGALKSFLDKGETTDMDKVIIDIDTLLPEVTDNGVRSTLEDLKNGLQKVKEIAIVSE